ncbi:MAG: hypothetical protein OHK0026_08260 [Rhodocyclaceae bacterium]
MSARAVLAFALALVLAGCVATWARIAEPAVEGPGGRYSVQAPVGWVRFLLDQSSITITRDGLPIQYIEVQLLPGDKAFPRTGKKLPAEALPAELAAMEMAELRSLAGLADMVVKSNTPATIAGAPGFRLHLAYRNARGAAFERIVLGAAQGKDLLLFSFHALSTHYFARDLPLFEQVVASWRPGKAK